MKLLSILFPPRLHKVESFEDACVAGRYDHINLPVTEDGILWRAYDVRMTGIERMGRDHP